MERPSKDPYSEMAAHDCASESRYFYWKNLIGISIAGMLLRMPYSAFTLLLSSLYPENGLGTWCLTVAFAVQSVVSMILPPIFMKAMGYKGSMLLSSGLISIFAAANMLPSFATLLPAAALGGIGFATMWTTANTLACCIATEYASLSGNQPSYCLNLFMGILHTSFESSGIWINLVAAFLMQPADLTEDRLTNQTCGASYCSEMAKDIGRNTSLPFQKKTALTTKQINGLCLVCLISAGFAALIIVTTVNFRKKNCLKTADITSVVLSTLRLSVKVDILLLTMITSGAAFAASFYASDFTKAFITCSIGIQYMGLNGVTYFVTCTIASVSVGYISRWTGNFSILTAAVLLTVSAIVFIFFWSPAANSVMILFVFSGVSGLTWAIFTSQIPVIYGENFKEDLEAAYSHQRLMIRLGLTLGYATSYLLCMKTKMTVVIVWTLIGYACYIVLEMRIRKRNTYTKFEG